MSKKRRKNKRKRTTQRLEVTPRVTERAKEQEPATVVDVLPDLKKTAILTAFCLGILLMLFFTQSRWSHF